MISGAMAPTVVLLHGFTHTGRSWDPVVAALGERYRCLAPDLRGHGSRSDVQPVSLTEVLDDLARLSAEPFSLVGYSMGGRIALHVALAQPHRVERLILIGASPGVEDAAAREQRRGADEALAAELEQLQIEGLARRWAQTPVLADQPPHVRQAAHADRLRSTSAGLARALRGLGAGALPSLWERLAELSMPLTLVVGERDEKFAEIADAMRRRAGSGARMIKVSGAGHAVHLENPLAVARLIEQEGR